MAINTDTKDPIFARLEQLIKESHPTLNSPASVITSLGSITASIAVLDNGKITSHMISALPNYNSDTLYQACSISKPCAGLAFAKLIEQGRLSLDDKVCNLLPDSVIQNMTSDARTAKLMRSVTVKQVMSHTAGLSVHAFPGYPVEYHPVDTLPDAKKILTGSQGVNTAKVQIISLPGLEFMYSGGGMTVLQVIGEHITGKPWPQVVQELVLEPLGMTRSCYALEKEETNVAEAYYTGYTKCDAKWHTLPEAFAAGLWTTPSDLLKMVRALQESLESESGGFLSREMARQILTQVKSTIGLTWFCNEFSMCHSGGNNPGYRCFMYGYADLPWNEKQNDSPNRADIRIPMGCGISIMSNTATGHDVNWKITHAIAYLKGWAEAPADAGIEIGAPFAVHGDIEVWRDQRWRDWIGVWADKDKKSTWKIDVGPDGTPMAGIEVDVPETMMALRTAAIPPIQYTNERQSVDLVIDGLEIMLRFGWEKNGEREEEEVRVVEVWHHELMSKKILYLRAPASEK